MYEQIIYGVIAGVGYSIVGWQKGVAQKKTKVEYDWLKLSKSVVICAIVGGVSAWQNLDFSMVIVGGLGIAVTNVVNMGMKIVSGWLKKRNK